jgi:hypothetical protein
LSTTPKVFVGTKAIVEVTSNDYAVSVSSVFAQKARFQRMETWQSKAGQK